MAASLNRPAAVQPLLLEALATAAVGAIGYGGYKLYRRWADARAAAHARDFRASVHDLRNHARDLDLQEQPFREENASRAYFAQHPDQITDHLDPNPYTMPSASYRPFGLETPAVALSVSAIRVSVSSKYPATQVRVQIHSIGRNRMYTGHQRSTTPQGHHLFSYEALLTGLEHFDGTAARLIGMLGQLEIEYTRLPNQTEEAQALLRRAPETFVGMLREQFTLDTWQRLLTRAVTQYIQTQQYSVHATSGYGSGGQSEGHYKEVLRQIEMQLANGWITPQQAEERAEEPLRKMFDFHGSQNLSYRQQSQREGKLFLAMSCPNIMALKDWKYV